MEGTLGTAFVSKAMGNAPATRRTLELLAVVALLAALAPAAASATDFCVDQTDPACPTGVAVNTPLVAAMESNANDGVADRVFLPPQTLAAPINFAPSAAGNDDLEVIGAGAGATVLTSAASGNIYVINLLGIGPRRVTMRDLTVRIPASFPDGGMAGYGSGLQASDDTFRRVTFESSNPSTPTGGGSTAVTVINGGVFDQVRVQGVASGGLGWAFVTGNAAPDDTLEINDSVVEDVGTGIDSVVPAGVDVHIRRSKFTSDYAYILAVRDGASSSIENSVLESGENAPLSVVSSDGDPDSAQLTVENSTIINRGGAPYAINVSVVPFSAGNAVAVITDSILFGFPQSWNLFSPANPGQGDAQLDVRYSNLPQSGATAGDGTVNSSLGNINSNPLFATLADYRLSASSPSIDAGDPAAGGLSTDIAGGPRPIDGDGDGSAVRDQGAYEAPALATCANTPSLCPDPPLDTTAPKITKVRFMHGKSPRKGGTLKLNLSEAATIRATFKLTPAKQKGLKKRRVVKLSKKGKAGANKLVIKKRKLKPGRYRLTIIATDAAGNGSKPLIRKVKVRS